MEINYDGTLYFQLELYFLILKRWLQLNVYIYELGMLRKKKYRAKIFFKSRFFFGGGGIPWMEEPGRQQSMGSLRVGHD